ncbi:serine hydrolase FSH [Pilobolus umbonatus]|nr:serine hydrolase FSH [Pilobolus umbonatus]
MSRKLRILCLHGMVQNSVVFRKKTSVIRKKLDKVAELVYVTAPQVTVDPRYTSEEQRMAAMDENAPEELKPFAWWISQQSMKEGFYEGFHESIDYLKAVMLKEGPFDGVFGFSQVAMENRTLLIGNQFNHPQFKFAILAAGFKPTHQTGLDSLWSHQIKTPTLHLIGMEDKLIPPELQQGLVDQCIHPNVLRHTGGHVVPSNAMARNEITAFVSSFIDKIEQ